MCRINAVGHFIQRQVHGEAGCQDDVTVMSWQGRAGSPLSGYVLGSLTGHRETFPIVNACCAASSRCGGVVAVRKLEVDG